ncbi:GNAT family N-acetyltransferase [Bacillaceae bacterium W0354]
MKQQLIIRPITMDDFQYVKEWSKDKTFCLANDWELNRNELELYNWWVNCVNHHSPHFIRQAIDLEGRMVGYADLAEITSHSAEIGIAIGESQLWGRGIGTRSVLKLIEYASNELGITHFTAITNKTNIRSINMLKKLKFEEVKRAQASNEREFRLTI